MPEYDHETIIRAFGILHKKNIDFELTIVGDGKLLPYLKQLATELFIIKKVKFVGRIPNLELPYLLQQNNFYISMPTTEGVSASLFEAMATGCYPIVSDIVGNQHFVENDTNGNLISVGDFNNLAETIIKVYQNIDLREKTILKNRKFVEQKANFEINMQLISDKYHQLILQNS